MFVVKSLIYAGIFFTAILSSTSLFAEEDFSVKLKSIEKIKAQEKGGDELHVSVTEFPKEGKPSHYQIPNFPSHWLSPYLYNVKNLTLWQKNMKSCTDVKVVFSLVEEDLAPWNTDDLLGAVTLDLKCEQGKMVSSWSIPNNNITEKVEKKPGEFVFKGEKAEYNLNFQVEKK